MAENSPPSAAASAIGGTERGGGGASSLVSGSLQAHACRLLPGSDLVPGLQASAASSAAVFVLTCVGSLSELTLRMANAAGADETNGDSKDCFRSWKEPLEIVSLVGTFATNPTIKAEEVRFHLHLSVSDASGSVFGGHLVAGRVHTTVELVLGSLEGVQFDRSYDADTGYNELVVSGNQKKNLHLADDAA